ncbi:MAG TPA: hypothetical protein VKU41_23540, partial [Polyangiaceae bacterium]|nr:hypothetical protein [Polyangiaceae bacterium]
MRIALAVVSLVVGGGCVLITGSTDGYSLRDGGSDAAPGECSSAASCSDGGVCCLAAILATGSPSGKCLPSCALALPQLCAMDGECGD